MCRWGRHMVDAMHCDGTVGLLTLQDELFRRILAHLTPGAPDHAIARLPAVSRYA